ncbi:hypothetical protein AAC387_Pa04g1458 [Persea americana]
MMLQDVMLMRSETSVRCLTCLKNRSGLLVWYTSYIPMTFLWWPYLIIAQDPNIVLITFLIVLALSAKIF